MTSRGLNPKITVGIVYVAAQFMSIMDTTIVNVALPKLGAQFRVPTSAIDAVIVGYLISLAVFIPASGWVGDRWGTKRVFLFALGLFSVASALCGVAGSLEQLIFFRVLQGAGGGMLTPVGLAMLYRTFPPHQRVQASRILILATVIAPATGPVLGGLLVDRLSWRWVFYVNVPIGVAAFVFGLLFLREHREAQPGRFDLPGFLLAGTGFPLVMFALSEGSSHGWTSFGILGTAAAGILVLIAFVTVELRRQEPMVQLRLLGNRLFATCNAVSMLTSSSFLGILFLTPVFLQEARGASALSSGLTTFPEALGVVVSSQIVARIYPYVGPRRLMAGGLTAVSIFMTSFVLIGLDTNAWVVRLLMFVLGASMANVFIPMQAAAFATISASATGRASTLFNALRQLGAATGVAVLSSVLAAAGPTRVGAGGIPHPNLAAYHAAYLTAAAIALTGALVSLAVPDRAAAPTMRRKGDRQPETSQPEPALVPDVG
jgi:EmrB/QacA subfamily drug resistance transporter